MNKLQISSSILQQIQSIIHKLYPEALVWAYGSRVKGNCHAGSDLDLVVIDFGSGEGSTSILREAFSNSSIPFLIDIRYWAKLPKHFQDEITNNYVVVYERKPG